MSGNDEKDQWQGSQLSIEEVGDSCTYNPEPDNKDDGDKKEVLYFVMFRDIRQKHIQNYRGYVISACTETEFSQVLHELIDKEEKGIQVAFLEASDGDDHYRIIIKCDNCANCQFKMNVQLCKCRCVLDSKDFVPIEELLALECKICGSSPNMRLNPQAVFNPCLKFHLVCSNAHLLRTPTTAKLSVETLDNKGRRIGEKLERTFAVCFHNQSTSSFLSPAKERSFFTHSSVSTENEQKLSKNFENILAMLQGERSIIQHLISKEVLPAEFLVADIPRRELIGKLIRQLQFSGDLATFIDALQTSQLPQNMELAEILRR